MKSVLHFLFLLTCIHQLGFAQNTIGYLFENNLKANNPSFPDLVILGRQGVYIQEQLPELDNMKKTAYQFERNCGVQFDNAAANHFLNDSYTIEIYFRFDKLNSWKRVIDFKNRKTDWGCYIFNGKLNFYNLLVSEKAPVNENEYTHYVISRDGATNTVKIFADGISKLEFNDVDKHTLLDEDQKLNFFYDDLKVTDEASAGAVVMIKLSNYVIPPDKILAGFESFKNNINYIAPITENIAPKKDSSLVHVTLEVKDKETQAPISDLTYSIKRNTEVLAGGNIEGKSTVSLDLPVKTLYYITFKSKGYVTYEDSIVTGDFDKEFRSTFLLEKIKVGTTVTLKTLQFERGKAELLPASYGELDKLAEFMKENPTVEIEISGHTDNQGDPKLNVELSENRVKATTDYLISKDIDKNRIKGKGYGGSKPIASNSREETRRLNRRVEMTIIKN
ncbi:MAG TPA: OmpA family protein [Cytophagaceae bacterium]|jgi:OOP family OmpA-OmpF porin|nr:OmpA family protein [Cytophagaceae bacterium]